VGAHRPFTRPPCTDVALRCHHRRHRAFAVQRTVLAWPVARPPRRRRRGCRLHPPGCAGPSCSSSSRTAVRSASYRLDTPPPPPVARRRQQLVSAVRRERLHHETEMPLHVDLVRGRGSDVAAGSGPPRARCPRLAMSTKRRRGYRMTPKTNAHAAAGQPFGALREELLTGRVSGVRGATDRSARETSGLAAVLPQLGDGPSCSSRNPRGTAPQPFAGAGEPKLASSTIGRGSGMDDESSHPPEGARSQTGTCRKPFSCPTRERCEHHPCGRPTRDGRQCQCTTRTTGSPRTFGLPLAPAGPRRPPEGGSGDAARPTARASRNLWKGPSGGVSTSHTGEPMCAYRSPTCCPERDGASLWLPSTREGSCRSGSAACATAPSRRESGLVPAGTEAPTSRNELAGQAEVHRDSDATGPSPVSLPASALSPQRSRGDGSRSYTHTTARAQLHRRDAVASASPDPRVTDVHRRTPTETPAPEGASAAFTSAGLSPAHHRLGHDRMPPMDASQNACAERARRFVSWRSSPTAGQLCEDRAPDPSPRARIIREAVAGSPPRLDIDRDALRGARAPLRRDRAVASATPARPRPVGIGGADRSACAEAPAPLHRDRTVASTTADRPRPDDTDGHRPKRLRRSACAASPRPRCCQHDCGSATTG